MNYPLQQKTKSKWTGKKTDDLAATSWRRERRLHQQRREHTLTDCDAEDRTHTCRERWDVRPLHHRAGYSHERWWDGPCCYERTDGFGEWGGSAPGGPRQKAAPTQRNGLCSWFAYVSVFLVLGAVLGVCQSAFKSF